MTNAEKFKTVKARGREFGKFCRSQFSCKRCKLKTLKPCTFTWLELEAVEELTTLPCPFCGGAVSKNELIEGPGGYIECKECGYRSRYYHNMDSAIAAHNRVAKAVMAAKKEVE